MHSLEMVFNNADSNFVIAFSRHIKRSIVSPMQQLILEVRRSPLEIELNKNCLQLPKELKINVDLLFWISGVHRKTFERLERKFALFIEQLPQ